MTKHDTQILTVAGIVIAVAALLFFTRNANQGNPAMTQTPFSINPGQPGQDYLTYNYPSPQAIASITNSDTAGQLAAQNAALAPGNGIVPATATACGCAGTGGAGQANTPFFSTVGALANSFTSSLTDIANSMQANLLSALPGWTTQSPGIAYDSAAAANAFGGT